MTNREIALQITIAAMEKGFLDIDVSQSVDTNASFDIANAEAVAVMISAFYNKVLATLTE